MNPHLTITADGILRITRTAHPIKSEAEVEALVAFARTRLQAMNASQCAVLVDLRRAPLRDETEFATPMAKLRAVLVKGSGRIAFLVETRTGALQVTRFLREESLEARVFSDEAEALASLG